MKRIILLLALFPAIVFSQNYQKENKVKCSSCLPEGIVFTNQGQIDNFQTNYPGCTETEGDVSITGNDITNLDGLIVLTTVGGDLNIGNSSSGNPNLSSLSGLNNVAYIGGNLEINSNHSLSNFSGLENLSVIMGRLDIYQNQSLTNLAGLDNLVSIPNIIAIWDNDNLTSLSGLNNLTNIEGELLIFDNDLLQNLSGLDALNTIGTNLNIQGNIALSSLSGLENLSSIGGSLTIGYWLFGGNPSLTNLNGLENLVSIGEAIIIKSNYAMTNLTGIQNINASSIQSLGIFDNSSLATCDVESICDYLASPNGIIEIHDNATGCNSPEEVEEACLVNTNELVEIKNDIQIFPNPAKKEITIISPSDTKIKEVIIFNQTGQKALQNKVPTNTIDISILQAGLYFVEVVILKNKVMKKLIIE